MVEKGEKDGQSSLEYYFVLEKLASVYNRASLIHTKYSKPEGLNLCICFALEIILTCAFYWPQNQKIMATTLVQHLTKAIKTTGGPSYWKRDIDLLVWLLFTAGLVPVDFEDKDWCSGLLCQIIARKFGEDGLWPSDWRRQLNAALQQFVWSDARFATFFTQTCLFIEQEVGSQDRELDDTR